MKLKELRKLTKLTQNQVSTQIGIPATTLFSYERGIREPNIETLIKLADFYHVTVDELIGRPTTVINKQILNENEKFIIENVLTLNDNQQELVKMYIQTLIKSK